MIMNANATQGLKVHTGVKAGAITVNHKEAPARDAAGGLKVKTGLKAGDGGGP
jgi:hypothetical protein